MIIYRAENGLFVKPEHAGIAFLIVITDSLPFHTFKRRKGVYLRVEDAIAWHEKEIKITDGKGGSRKALEMLKSALVEYQSNSSTQE